MVLAYHRVEGGAWLVDRILRDGQVLPAAFRLSMQVVADECEGFLRTERSRGAKAHAIEAVRAVVFAEMARSIDVRPKADEKGHEFTLLNCSDIVAGDLFAVFLQPFQWYAGPRPSGFVFDAEGLLMAGASYRPRDFLGAYAAVVRKVLHGHSRGREGALRELEEGLGNVLEGEVTGQDAVQALLLVDGLRKMGDAVTLDNPGEIVWRGDLPTDRALEIWKDGKRTR